MSAVSVAEQRAWSALQRLEQALGSGRPAGGAEEQAVLERDCELLRQEGDSLRRGLGSVEQGREGGAGGGGPGGGPPAGGPRPAGQAGGGPRPNHGQGARPPNGPPQSG